MPSKKRIKLKICLLGDPAVGKTSLVQKYVYNLFSDGYMRTMGTKVSRKLINFYDRNSDTDFEIVMMLWDIMGQQFASMPMDKYLKMTQGALIVCDITRRDTLSNILTWKDMLFKETGDIPLIYLANKVDLQNQQQSESSINDFIALCEKEGVEYFLTSAKTGENVEQAFNTLGELVVSGQMSSKQVPPEEKVPSEKELEGIELIIQQTVKHPKAVTKTKDFIDNQVRSDLAIIKAGLGYIVKEEQPLRSFEIFKKLIGSNANGLCISRIHPSRIEAEYKLNDSQAQIYWLSAEAQQKRNILAPTFLPQLNTVIKDFIQKYNDVIILLEGIEYLIEKNDFKAILNLIHSLNDSIMVSKAVLLIPIDPLILKEQEMHMLSRDLKVI